MSLTCSISIASSVVHSDAHQDKSKINNHRIFFDHESTVSMPMGCILDATLPCVFKSLKRQTLQLGDMEITLLSGSVVKILSLDPIRALEPLQGGFIIDKSDKPIKIKSHMLNVFPSYAVKTKDQVEVIDGKDFYTIKFNQDQQERVLLDKVDFVKKMALFFNNKQEFKIKLKEISAIYDKSFRNDIALQKQLIQRQIASIEQKKQDEEDRRKIERDEKKKTQQYFFKRTFER